MSSSAAAGRRLVLAFDAIKDPRDLAEVIHLAAGAGAEVHAIGASISPRHWKVLRKLRSWRPDLAGDADRIRVAQWPSLAAWARACTAQGLRVAGTVVCGGKPPWSGPPAARLAVVFGEESSGLRQADLAICDELWTLPMGEGGRFYTVGQSAALVVGGWLRG